MNQAASSRVLHLVPPNGGGVDRFVRDLCSLRPDDWLLHVSDDQCVLECAAQDLFVPVAAADLGALVERAVLGRATALHAHSTVAAVRRTTQLLAAGMDLPYVVTLHDIEFAGSAEPDERAERLAFIRSAARCTVPSSFMRDVAIAALGASFDCVVVENGVDALAPAAGAPGPAQYPIAVIGALGQHKGLARLLAVAGALPADLRIVLIGYADGQLGAGWLGGDRIRVHGAFEPAELPELVAHYGAKIAFFPKGQPESYCYALSDAWLAGLPVVGPDCGAIGERVRANGGGSLYDPEAAAADVALAITMQLAAAQSGRADVAAAVRSLTSVAAMADKMNEIYAAIAAPGTVQAPPDLAALKRAAMNHLDSRFFRKELLRLQGDLDAAEQQRDNALQELQALAGEFARRGEWIDHLQQGIDGLREHLAGVQPSLDALRQENVQLQEQLAGLESLRAEHAALQQAHAALQTAYDTLKRRVTWPLRLLPAPVRAWVIRMVKRKFFVEGRNG